MRNGSNKLILDAFIGDSRHIGTLTMNDDESKTLSFTYTQKWQDNGFALSPHIPLDGSATHGAIINFLDNLLPEGKGFDMVMQNTTVSRNNKFAMAKMFGREAAGAISFRSPDSKPSETRFTEVSEEALTQHLDDMLYRDKPLAYWDGSQGIRLSVAGVQDKLNFLEMDGKFGFGDGALCSNTICKFETGKIPCIAVNEHFTMTLANLSGLNVPAVSLRRFGDYPALVVDRFDRKLASDNHRVFKMHVIDACQALNLPASYKYERNFGDEHDVKHIRDGVSFRKLFELELPFKASYVQALIKWTIFNVIVNNYDAHGKNLSFSVSDKGLNLMPFYDIVNIQAIADEGSKRNKKQTYLSRDTSTPQHFAMSFGDYEAGSEGIFEPPVGEYAFAMLAIEANISLPRMKLMMENSVGRILGIIDKAADITLSHDLTEQEREHVNHCKNLVRANCTMMLEAASKIIGMQALI